MNLKNIFLSGFISKIILLFLCLATLESAAQDSLQMYLSEIASLNDSGNSNEALLKLIRAEEYLMYSDRDAATKSQLIFQIYFQEIDIENINREHLDSLSWARAYEYIAIRNLLSAKYEEAENGFHKVLEITENTTDAYRAYKWLAALNLITQKSKKAIEYYRKAIDGVSALEGLQGTRKQDLVLALHSNLVSAEVQAGNLISAKKSSAVALDLALKQDDPYYRLLSYLNIVSLNVALHDPEKILSTLAEAKEYLTDNSNLTAVYYNSMATAYWISEELDSAKLYYQVSIDFMEGKPAHLKSKFINQAAIANINYHQKDYELCLSSYSEVISEYLKYPDRFNQYLSRAYTGRAKAYQAMGDLDKAYDDLKKSIRLPGEYKTWKIKDYANLTLMYACIFEAEQEEVYADSVMWSLSRTDSYIDSVRIEDRFLEGEVGLNEFLYDSYSLNLESLYKVYKSRPDLVDEESLFKYFEKIKSYSLKEYLKTDEAVKAGMLPANLLEKERNYKSKLAGMKKEEYKLISSEGNKERNAELSNQIQDLASEYISFLKTVEKDYPTYFDFQYRQHVNSLQDVRTFLAENEVIIEFFKSRDAIYTLTIDKNKARFYKTETDKKWKERYSHFLRILSQSPELHTESFQPSSKRDFINSANQIYDQLLKLPLSELDQSIDKLIIIADNQLNFLPFSVLLNSPVSEETSYRDLPYLFKDYTLSYDASVFDYMNDLKVNKKRFRQHYTGFSPSYTEGLNDLPYSRKCVNEVAELFEGKALTGKDASLENISSSIEESRILHFAMHGVQDQLNPSLSHFKLSSDEKDNLYLSDIYNKEIKASLAVLSACNTGSGKYLKGEGIQNLSRAFRFAGVGSTIMSLWSIPDVQTAQIDSRFFHHLKEKKRIDESLQLAQIDYLNNAPEAYLHPFYWAAFIASGNTDVVQTERNISLSDIVLRMAFLVLLFLFIFLVVKKMRS